MSYGEGGTKGVIVKRTVSGVIQMSDDDSGGKEE